MLASVTIEPHVFSPTSCGGFRSDRERRALYRYQEEKAETPDSVVFVQVSRDQLVTFGRDAFLIAYAYGWGTDIVCYDLVGPAEQKVDAAWVRASYLFPITCAIEAEELRWRIAPLVGEGDSGA